MFLTTPSTSPECEALCPPNNSKHWQSSEVGREVCKGEGDKELWQALASQTASYVWGSLWPADQRPRYTSWLKGKRYIPSVHIRSSEHKLVPQPACSRHSRWNSSCQLHRFIYFKEYLEYKQIRGNYSLSLWRTVRISFPQEKKVTGSNLIYSLSEKLRGLQSPSLP